MDNKDIYRIGDSYETKLVGQIFVIVLSIIFVLLGIVLCVIDSIYIWLLFGAILFVGLIIFISSKIYSIEYDSNWFYLKRLFFETKKISVDSFLEIRRISIFGFLHVVFKEKRVLTVGSSKDAYNIWKILMTQKEYNKMYTAEVITNIERARKLHNCEEE